MSTNTPNEPRVPYFERVRTRLGPLETYYRQPDGDVSTSAEIKSHSVLDDGTDFVTQKLSNNPDKIEITGHCFTDEKAQLRQISKGDVIQVRSVIWDGTALVENLNYSTNGGMDDDGTGTWMTLIDFTISLIESEATE